MPIGPKGTCGLIKLDEDAYQRLYEQVLVVALRSTSTTKASQQATRADLASLATQCAFERCWRVRPANLDTVEKLRKYLVWSMRSELSNFKQEEAVRRRRESAASSEQVIVEGTSGASAEVVHLEAASAEHSRHRAARAIPRIRKKLEDAPIVLATIDCIKRGKTKPAEQARILGCSIDEIHAARKRRKRVVRAVLAEIDAEDLEREMEEQRALAEKRAKYEKRAKDDKEKKQCPS